MTRLLNAILDALRSPGAMMIALVLALFPQGEHTAQVFLRFSHEAGESARFFAYAFAAAVEVAVLLFVLAGHKRISFAFAGASFLTNIVYYAIGGVVLLSAEALPALLLSALLPACIMGYSHTIADKTAQGDKETPEYKPAKAPGRPQKAATPTASSNTTISTDSAAPRPATPPSEADNAPSEPAEPTPAKLTPAQRRAHIAEQELFDGAQVAAQFGVSLRTAQIDIAQVRKAATVRNGKAVAA